jgi:hypothetical protein
MRSSFNVVEPGRPEMRDYARIAPHFWTGTTGRKIRAAGRNAQVIALYLITAPSANMLGLYYLPLPVLCHEVGISVQGARAALRSLSEVGFAHYDDQTEHIWVPEMARFQIGETLRPSDKWVAGVWRELQKRKSCRFALEFHRKYRERFHLPEMADLAQGSRSLEGPSKVLHALEQELEQEQERLEGPSKVLHGQEQERELELEQEQDVEVEKEEETTSSSSLRGVRRSGGMIHPFSSNGWGSPESLVDLYNSSVPPGHPRVTKLSAGRRAKAKTYLAQFPEREFWRKAFAQIGRSEFLRGRRSTPGREHFIADFDWLLTRGRDGTENVVKVAEGRYEDHESGDDYDAS